MSASGTMRGPLVMVKTPPLLLLLLLLLTARLTTVSCQDYIGDYLDEENPEEILEEEPLEDEGGTEDEDVGGTDLPPDPEDSPPPDPESFAFTTLSPSGVSDDPGSGDSTIVRSITEYGEDGSPPPPDGSDQPPEDVDDGLGLIIIVIPVALVAVIIAVICGIFMHRRLNQKVRNPDVHTEDPYFEGSSTEKVPMPMFEEDVPSVLEVEMDDLDQWMKKDVETADDS